jgi:thiosulfate/3-mercaptopyruvate sulfurtransferase
LSHYTTTVAADSVAAHLHDPGWVLVDCRHSLAAPEYGRQAYAEGHLPGAFHAHLDEDLSGPVSADTGRHPLPDAEVFARRVGDWGIGPDTQVVAYDDASGAIAARLWWLMRWLGHDAVAVLDGGVAAWLAAGYALDATPAAATPVAYAGAPGSGRVITADELGAALRCGWRLLDARDAERFRGDVEPLDEVAGHIPGARNQPYMHSLDADNRFLPAPELRRRLEAALDGVSPERAAWMCGSGVTACHALLAMEIAGLPGARLYAGSWSEWLRDTRRPVATGPA